MAGVVKPAVAAVLAAALLSACQTAQTVTESISSVTDGKREQTALDEMRADPGTGPCGGDGAIARRLAEVDYGLGIVQQAELEAYVNGVMAKLVAASPEPACRTRVFVIPNNDLTTVASADGGVLVPLGLLRALRSEDELAAILGHELSHILYRHHDSDAFLSSQDTALKGIDAAYGAHAMFSSLTGQGTDLGNTKLVAEAVYEVSEGVVAPAWTRGQEDEADLLGTDLATAAGYNPTAMTRIMDLLAAYEEQIAQREELQEEMQGDAFRDEVYGSFASPQAASSMTTTSALMTVGAAAIKSASSLFEDDSHRPASERKELVNDYVREFHRNDRRRSFTEEPFVGVMTAGPSGEVLGKLESAAEARRLAFAGDLPAAEGLAREAVTGVTETAAYPRLAFYEVRKLQGNPDRAGQNLDIALRSEAAPWSVYRNRATLAIDSGSRDEAIRLVDAANRRFGEPLAIVPFAITAYKASGRMPEVAALLERCRTEGSRAFFENCQSAAGLDPDRDSGAAQTPDALGIFQNFLGN